MMFFSHFSKYERELSKSLNNKKTSFIKRCFFVIQVVSEIGIKPMILTAMRALMGVLFVI